MWSRIIHAWPSFALIGAYELLMREFRTAARSVRNASAARDKSPMVKEEEAQGSGEPETWGVTDLQTVYDTGKEPVGDLVLSPFQDRAWQWALEQQRETGRLPSGKEIAAHFGRKERWGRLVKQRGQREGFLTKVE